MPRKEDEPLQKHTLFLYEGDFARLKDIFPDVDSSVVIRRAVRALIKKVEGTPPEPKVEKIGDLE